MCGSFMSGIGQQVGSALGGGANPLQSIGTGGGGGFGFGGGIPAPMQNPFLGGSSGGGMSQPMPAGWEPKLSSVNTTTTQDIMGRGSSGVPFGQAMGQLGMGGGMGQPMSAEDAWRLHSAMALYAPGTDMAKEKQNFIANYNARQGVPQYGGQDRVVTQVGRPLTDVPQYGGGTPFTFPPQVDPMRDSFHPGVPVLQGPGAGVTPEMLSRLLQGTPSDANGPYPAQVSTLPFQPQQISLQQQRMMDRLNQQFGRQMQPYQQQMEQLQQKYMSQPPLQFDQELQKMPEYQAMQKAAQSGNFEEANRLRNAFESSPQFKQFELTRNAYDQQRQQAEQKMLADPRFNQLQNRMQELERRKQRLIQARLPQPQVFPAQPRPQVLPSEGLGTGLAGLLGGMMF